MSLAVVVVMLWVIAPVLLYLIGALAGAILEGRLPFIGSPQKAALRTTKTGPEP